MRKLLAVIPAFTEKCHFAILRNALDNGGIIMFEELRKQATEK